MTGSPRLSWALLTAFDPGRAGRVPADLGRMWQVAGESLNLVARPIERFELAGTLNHHPGHVRSDRAKQNFPAIFALAVAGRSAREPLRTHSRAAAALALLSWARVYRATGNPVDEWFFVPLLQAVDLVAGLLPPAQEAALLRWAHTFAISGDRFYDRLGDRNPARANNWMARRLLIRAVASTVAGDAAARAAMPGLLREFAARNYVAGPSGERDGRTFDFIQRDALHYHIAAVQPLAEVLLYAPGLVDPVSGRRSCPGLSFSGRSFSAANSTSSSPGLPSRSTGNAATTATRPSATRPGILPAAASCCAWPGRRSPRSGAGPSRSSTTDTTRAPSSWPPSTASRSAGPNGHDPLRPGPGPGPSMT